MLKETGIQKNDNKTSRLFNKAISNDFMNIKKMKSSDYVRHCWTLYEEACKSNPKHSSLSGNIFELIVASELYRQSLCPMYLQAEVAFVPNVKFDILLYSSNQFPIGLSLKTSLRERYKQTDLEAVALKYVHRRAKNYLITLDHDEAERTKNKAEKGDLLGINRIIIANNNDFDELIEELSDMTFITPEPVDIVKGNVINK